MLLDEALVTHNAVAAAGAACARPLSAGMAHRLRSRRALLRASWRAWQSSRSYQAASQHRRQRGRYAEAIVLVLAAACAGGSACMRKKRS